LLVHILGGMHEKNLTSFSTQQTFGGDLLGEALAFAFGVVAVPDIRLWSFGWNGRCCQSGWPLVPVATVVGMVGEGMAEAEILNAYPDLEVEDVREALRYAAEAVRERELPVVGGS
jgi:uncharacterized protein (DUF433 family)